MNNQAIEYEGGGIYCENINKFSLQNTFIDSNNANLRAGGYYHVGQGFLTAFNSNFNYNQSLKGAGLYITDGSDPDEGTSSGLIHGIDSLINCTS